MCCPVRIVERESTDRAEGTIRPIEISDIVLWTRWHEEMPPDAEDSHWEWDSFIEWSVYYPERLPAYALDAQSNLQGLMSLETTGPAIREYGTHVLRLSTAPWNRPPMRRFFAVGSLLIARAILHSLDDGYDGRIHLESLSGSERFYEKIGMVEFENPGETDNKQVDEYA